MTKKILKTLPIQRRNLKIFQVTKKTIPKIFKITKKHQKIPEPWSATFSRTSLPLRPAETEWDTQTHWDRLRQRDTQWDTLRQRHTETHTLRQRQTERQTHWDRDTVTHRHSDRDTVRHRHSETQTHAIERTIVGETKSCCDVRVATEHNYRPHCFCQGWEWDTGIICFFYKEVLLDWQRSKKN